jgi:hypothetical protein
MIHILCSVFAYYFVTLCVIGFDVTAKAPDIHESNLEYMNRSRQAADYCAAKLGWRVVECCDGDRMRTVEEIGVEIRKIVDKLEILS